jgi:CTP synthase (UTP-ammonia lyase)
LPERSITASAAKYIFVTGGVALHSAKELFPPAQPKLHQAAGSVTIQFDPYINGDPGTLSPTSTANAA